MREKDMVVRQPVNENAAMGICFGICERQAELVLLPWNGWNSAWQLRDEGGRILKTKDRLLWLGIGIDWTWIKLGENIKSICPLKRISRVVSPTPFRMELHLQSAQNIGDTEFRSTNKGLNRNLPTFIATKTKYQQNTHIISADNKKKVLS